VTLPVVWLPEADAELKEALARYESIHPELAQRVRRGGGGYYREGCGGPFAPCGSRKGTAARRSAPIPLWDILPSERDADCGDFLFPRAAQSKTLAAALNCCAKHSNASESLVERYAFAACA